MENKKTPDIRFTGFTGDWEQKKLGEVAKITMGQSPNGVNYTENPEDHILVQGNADIKKGWVAPRIWTTQITKTAQKGDIILSVRAPVGDVGKTQFDIVLGRGVAGIKGNEFIFQLLNKMKSNGFWTRYSTGSTFESINSNDIKEAIIILPEKAEQTSIGTVFSQLDDIITLHQQELDTLKQTKQGFLQKMFPKEGESVPEVRFSGFSGDWDQRELGDLTNIKTGSSDLQDAVDDGEYPFFVRSENVERSNRYIFDGEAILIPGEGRLGDIYHYINGKFDYHQRVYKISEFTDSNIYGKFVLYYLQQNFKRHALKFTVKATVDSLRLPMLVNFEIRLPKYEEQQKIGNFFKQLDETITLHEQELETLKQTKKAFLQKMFV